ncbi:MAG: substrate-binding domain-containing protein [Kiritimatiellae bacterium]|nr:substrate-binding domain-containing protein [Kiritimatiellia bacterium]
MKKSLSRCVVPAIGNGGRKPRVAVVCERDRAYGRRVCIGIASAAVDTGWTLEFVDPGDFSRLRPPVGFDGAIVRVSNRRLASALEKSGIPSVDIYTDTEREWCSSVDSDQTEIGCAAAAFFLKRRYGSFAFCGYGGIGYSDKRCAAFSAAVRESGFDVSVFNGSKKAVDDFGASVISGEKVALGADAALLARWVRSLPRHTAVFCCHDVRAWQVIHVCRAVGIDVPGHLAVLGVDNDELVCSFVTPSISSIDNSAVRAGERAVELLEERMRGLAVRHEKIAPVGTFERESTHAYPACEPWVAGIFDYIAANCRRRVGVSDVIAFSGRPQSTVERAVKAAAGTTVRDFLLSARFEAARQSLLFTDLPVSRVARLSGFASSQYFCRFFKARTGETPESFRNRLK